MTLATSLEVMIELLILSWYRRPKLRLEDPLFLEHDTTRENDYPNILTVLINSPCSFDLRTCMFPSVVCHQQIFFPDPKERAALRRR